MYEQQKGKALDKLPAKINFDTTEYLVSTKYDGNRIFIVKIGSRLSFFTSDWKPFNFPQIPELLENYQDFSLECELNYNSIGKLGDRVHSAILTTWRTNFNKGICTRSLDISKVQIKVFDYLEITSTGYTTKVPYYHRLEIARTLKLPKFIQVITTAKMLGIDAKLAAKNMVKQGWEGLICVEPNSYYDIGKRGNHIVKLKYRKTADLLCIGVEEGEGKYQGMIGALVLKDSVGRVVSVGSGLDDQDRLGLHVYYIGKIIEIEYEQIIDTYIQPTFVGVRRDKYESD